ncbi:MAG: hypothetical protein AAGJ52_09095 [Pseudomonadota bacterium]
MRSTLNRRLVTWTSALIFSALSTSALAQNLNCVDVSGQTPNGGLTFEDDVRPIFEDSLYNCTNCHGNSGGLSLDEGNASHANLFCADTQSSFPQPSEKRIVPGAPMESWFYLRIACELSGDPAFRMPRNGQFFIPSSDLRVIYDWILQGAPSAEEIFGNRFSTGGSCP